MRFVFSFFFLSGFCYSCFTAFSQNTFQKVIGGWNIDNGFNIQKTADFGYVVAGTTTTYGGSYADIYLLKFDSLFNIKWTKNFGTNFHIIANSIQRTTDLGYIICGSAQYDLGTYDVLLMKVDSAGNPIWEKLYGGDYIDIGYSAIQTNDSGFLAFGRTTSFGAGSDFYLIKTDSSGNYKWAKVIGTSNSDNGYRVLKANDGGYLLCGSSNNGGIMIVKTDFSGNMSWSRIYKGTSFFFTRSIIAQDSCYVITGYYNYGMLLMKINNSGNIIWAKTYGVANFNGTSVALCSTSDNGYVITGWTTSFGFGYEEIIVIKTDNNGLLLWAKTYGGTQTDMPADVIETYDKSLLVLGYTENFGFGVYDIYLIKIDSMGNNGCNETAPVLNTGNYSFNIDSGYMESVDSTITTTAFFSVEYDNGEDTLLCIDNVNEYNVNRHNCLLVHNTLPGAEIIFPDYSFYSGAKTPSKLFIGIYDIFGGKIYHNNISSERLLLNKSDFRCSGMYFYEISDENGFRFCSGKLLIMF